MTITLLSPPRPTLKPISTAQAADQRPLMRFAIPEDYFPPGQGVPLSLSIAHEVSGFLSPKGVGTMARAQWLQDRRMQKFRDVLSRWERRELSAMDAGEILGVSERQFRRYRQRYEEEGPPGLLDKRLGKASAKRVPVD